MAAQFSVACGLPLSVLLLKGLPTRGGGNAIDALAPLYAAVMLIFGLLISWCARVLLRAPSMYMDTPMYTMGIIIYPWVPLTTPCLIPANRRLSRLPKKES